MARSQRTQGGTGAIWKTFSQQAQHQCLECHAQDTLRYVGFAPNYTLGFYARLYHCEQCGAWVDAVWPKLLGKPADLQNALV